MPWSIGPAVCQDAPDHALGGGIYFDQAWSNIHLVLVKLLLFGGCLTLPLVLNDLARPPFEPLLQAPLIECDLQSGLPLSTNVGT